MSKQNIVIGIVAVLAIVISVVALVSNKQSVPSKFGAIGGETNLNTLGITGLKVGSSCGDEFGSSSAAGCAPTTHLIAKSCTLIGTDGSQAASSTKQYDCAITGVTSADNVIAQIASSSLNAIVGNDIQGYWSIVAAKASSTAGFVSVSLYNNGVARTPSASGVGSSTAVLIFQ